MSLKKFIAPNLVVLLLLSVVWLAGVDKVYLENDHQQNLSKYLQVQQRIVDNYVGETDVNVLFKNSMKGFVKSLNENSDLEEVDVSGTPADTSLQDSDLKDFRAAFFFFF